MSSPSSRFGRTSSSSVRLCPLVGTMECVVAWEKTAIPPAATGLVCDGISLGSSRTPVEIAQRSHPPSKEASELPVSTHIV
jgi:hypothetical protein